MTDQVKRFIEENIDIINNEEWHQMFLSWYLHYGSHNSAEDRRRLNELVNVIESTIDSDFGPKSYQYRHEIIEDMFEEYINICINKGLDAATLFGAKQHLNTHLGFDDFIFSALWRKAAKKCGFELLSPKTTINLKD